MTRYRELYEKGEEVLKAAGIGDADLDARILLEEVCGTNLQTLLVDPDREVADADCRKYQGFIERRAAHEPTAMILGKWDFCGLTFKVTHDTLIPEQDTERLVEVALERLERKGEGFRQLPLDTYIRRLSGGSDSETEYPKVLEKNAERDSVIKRKSIENRENSIQILDLCTGSGCILLSLLHFLPEAYGVGTDLSAPALEVAKENAKRLGLAERSLFLQGDLWDALKTRDYPDHCSGEDCVIHNKSRFEGGGDKGDASEADLMYLDSQKFDLIVSNPPYVPTDVIPTLQPEVREGEPRLALDGGPDGLVFYRRILKEAGRHLKPGGIIIVESGFDEAGEIRKLFENAGFSGIRVDQDYGGLDRVVSGRWEGEKISV